MRSDRSRCARRLVVARGRQPAAHRNEAVAQCCGRFRGQHLILHLPEPPVESGVIQERVEFGLRQAEIDRWRQAGLFLGGLVRQPDERRKETVAHRRRCAIAPIQRKRFSQGGEAQVEGRLQQSDGGRGFIAIANHQV